MNLRIVPFEGTPEPLPASGYTAARGQYRAESLLALLGGYSRHVLGITHRDLYAGGLNFIFGSARAW